MDYSHTYFGKSINDLTWQDIEAFFVDAKEETDTIEFKSFVAGQGTMDKKYETLFKATCGFLNSNGGILIWGAPKGTTVAGKKEEIFKGALSPIDIVLEKDALISKISSKIIPMPKGINVRILENGTTCVCVFEIQKSQYAPHQANGTYYMRLDGQSVPAPHHYIEALFKQIRYPDIEGYVKINGLAQVTGGGYHLSLEVFIINWSVLQNETNVSFRLTTTKGVFLGFNNTARAANYWLNGKQLINNNIIDVLHHGAPVRESATIVITAQELVLNNYTMELLLHFGGKNSPLKTSEYKLTLRALNRGENANSFITEKKESQFVHELPQSMQLSKEEKLQIILER